MTEYVLSLSYGKDSIACIFAIKALGWPLDRIVHAEVWATDTIPADLPPMVEFKVKADEIIFNLTGIRVEHLCATRNGEKLTYEKLFYHIPKRKPGGKFSDDSAAGFPYTKGAWCNDRLKTNPLDAVSGIGGGGNHRVPLQTGSMVQWASQNSSLASSPAGSRSQSGAGARSSKTDRMPSYPPHQQDGRSHQCLGATADSNDRVFQKLPCTRSEDKYCAVPRYSG